jgi:hypothetical protein
MWLTLAAVDARPITPSSSRSAPHAQASFSETLSDSHCIPLAPPFFHGIYNSGTCVLPPTAPTAQPSANPSAQPSSSPSALPTSRLVLAQAALDRDAMIAAIALATAGAVSFSLVVPSPPPSNTTVCGAGATVCADSFSDTKLGCCVLGEQAQCCQTSLGPGTVR